MQTIEFRFYADGDDDCYDVRICLVTMEYIPRIGEYIYFFVDQKYIKEFPANMYRPYEVVRIDHNITFGNADPNTYFAITPEETPRIVVVLEDILMRQKIANNRRRTGGGMMFWNKRKREKLMMAQTKYLEAISMTVLANMGDATEAIAYIFPDSLDDTKTEYITVIRGNDE